MDEKEAGVLLIESLIHDGIGFRVASHGLQDGSFGLQGGEILRADRGAAERLVNGAVSPDETFFQIDFVIRAELSGVLPILIVKAGPSSKILAHLVNVELGDVGDFNLEGDALFLPLEIGDGRSGTALIEAEGHEFRVGRVEGIDRDA